MAKLNFNEDYSPEEIHLLACIGEAYLGMTYGASEDESAYRRALKKAINDFDNLQEDITREKKVTVYRAYLNPNKRDFKWKDFKTKAEAIKFVKANNWDVVTKFVYEDQESYDRDAHRLEETDVYIRPGFDNE